MPEGAVSATRRMYAVNLQWGDEGGAVRPLLRLCRGDTAARAAAPPRSALVAAALWRDGVIARRIVLGLLRQPSAVEAAGALH